VAHSLRVRINTRYLWIGLDLSYKQPDWIRLDTVSKNGPMSNSDILSADTLVCGKSTLCAMA